MSIEIVYNVAKEFKVVSDVKHDLKKTVHRSWNYLT